MAVTTIPHGEDTTKKPYTVKYHKAESEPVEPLVVHYISSKDETPAPAVFHTCGNFVVDTANEIALLTKDGALQQASELAGRTQRDLFKLGGLLKRIKDEKWFSQHQNFFKFVFQEFGYKQSFAYELIKTYDRLVTNEIPWEKVESIGWTKIEMLAPILTPKNVTAMVDKASAQTVKQLKMTVLKTVAKTAPPDSKSPDKVTDVCAKVTAWQSEKQPSETIEPVAEPTEVSNPNPSPTPELDAMMLVVGWELVLMRFGELFPSIDLTVDTQNA